MMKKFKKAMLLSLIIGICYTLIPFVIFDYSIVINTYSDIWNLIILWMISVAQGTIIIDLIEEF